MKSRTRTFAMIGLLGAAIAAYSGYASSCEAADRSGRTIDSGQSRDLINQPYCWPPEQSDSPYCELTKI